MLNEDIPRSGVTEGSFEGYRFPTLDLLQDPESNYTEKLEQSVRLQAEHLEESSALATRLQDELAEVTGSEIRGVKQAPFRVLVGATMPAVLVEVAFISNPEEEKLLASPRFQAKVAAALRRGISRYKSEWAARHGFAGAGQP